jgi:hypothetical protein
LALHFSLLRDENCISNCLRRSRYRQSSPLSTRALRLPPSPRPGAFSSLVTFFAARVNIFPGERFVISGLLEICAILIAEMPAIVFLLFLSGHPLSSQKSLCVSSFSC